MQLRPRLSPQPSLQQPNRLPLRLNSLPLNRPQPPQPNSLPLNRLPRQKKPLRLNSLPNRLQHRHRNRHLLRLLSQNLPRLLKLPLPKLLLLAVSTFCTATPTTPWVTKPLLPLSVATWASL